ncbi:MAG: hypothetical protein JHC12_00110 [Thermogladius sp.]|nr:hypothetical protein [Thermogladius sp.]
MLREERGLDCEYFTRVAGILEAHFQRRAVEALSVAFLFYRERVGRMHISRRLGLTERQVRGILEKLRKLSGGELDLLEGFMNSLRVERASFNGFESTIYSPFSPRLIECLANSIIYFRDSLVVALEDFRKIYLIGVKSDRLGFPLAPEDLTRVFIENLDPRAGANSIVVVWSRYEPVVDDVAVVSSLTRMCREVCTNIK